MEYLNSLTLSDFGSWASIIGFIITGITFWYIYNIKNDFLFRSRVSEHKEALTNISSEISGYLTLFNDNKDIIVESFSIADIKLRNIEKGASGHLLSDIKIARKKIKKFNNSPTFFDGQDYTTGKFAREIRTELNKVIEELSNVQKELTVGK